MEGLRHDACHPGVSCLRLGSFVLVHPSSCTVMEKKAGCARNCRTFSVRAFMMISPGARFCRCRLEKVKGWWLTDGERWKRPCHRWPHIQVIPCLTPHHLLDCPWRTGKNRALFPPAPTPPSATGVGQAAGTALHHHSDQFEPQGFFLASPCRPSGYQHWPQSVPGALAQMPAPRYKGVCLYSKWAVAHSESAHSKAAHVTAPPARSPSRTDANLWLETFPNMSLAQGVGFPGLLCPGRPSQEF